MKKKLLFFTFVFVIAISIKNAVFAEDRFGDMVNLTTKCPAGEEVSVYGIDMPDSEDYVNLNQKTLEFSGKENSELLYTNQYFTGVSAINFKITNHNSSRLIIKFYDIWNLIGINCDEILIEANCTLSGTRSGFDAEHYYYVSFEYVGDGEGNRW